MPNEMTGEPIHTDGAVDAPYVQDLADRLAVIGPRRAPVIGVSVLAWVILAALVLAVFRRAGLETALTILATSLALVPALLLVGAATEPSELAERLIVGIGCPALAVALLWLAPGLRGLAIGAAVSVVAYGVDVIAGSHLTELSLIGPNPIAGVRFYGIGNELEATIAALVPLGTGAALAGWAPRGSPRGAAVAFALTGIAAILVFAPGRFGADVGAAIDIAIGAAVAVGVCLGARRWRWIWVIAAPIGAVAALVLIDLASGGNAHLTRSVLDAGGLGDLGQVHPLRELGDLLGRDRRDRGGPRFLALCPGVVWRARRALGRVRGGGRRDDRGNACERLRSAPLDDRRGALRGLRRRRLGHTGRTPYSGALEPSRSGNLRRAFGHVQRSDCQRSGPGLFRCESQSSAHTRGRIQAG
ncbi:MAG: hypothetical protein E6G49_08350 [Actinobacteria bacterium]|nr:MAG: hypothetical protein E6G49_08350 [Actinomycetota bacterium]